MQIKKMLFLIPAVSLFGHATWFYCATYDVRIKSNIFWICICRTESNKKNLWGL